MLTPHAGASRGRLANRGGACGGGVARDGAGTLAAASLIFLLMLSPRESFD